VAAAGATRQRQRCRPNPATVASPPSDPAPAAIATTIEVKVPDIGDFKDVEVIEILVVPGAGGDPGAIVAHRRERQGFDGDSPVRPRASCNRFRSRSATRCRKELPSRCLPRAWPDRPRSRLPRHQRRPQPWRRRQPPRGPAPSTSPASTAFAMEMAERPLLAEDAGSPPHASPSVRKFRARIGRRARARVAGSAPKGRITQDDVRAHVKSALADPRPRTAAAAPAIALGGGLAVLPWPQIDFAKFGPVERVAMSRIRKLSGPNLHRNWISIPHVTNNEDADITELEAFRVQLNREKRKRAASR